MSLAENRKADDAKVMPLSEVAPAGGRKSKLRKRALMLSLPLVLAIAGGASWLLGGRYVETENAYVQQPIVTVSPDVSGRIVEVLVSENQRVEAGTPLFRIDAEPYRIALEEAEAQLAANRLGVDQLRAAYAAARAQLDAAGNIYDVQKRELSRQTELAERGVASSTVVDQVTLAARSAQNAVALAQEQLNVAAAALGGDPKAQTDDIPSVRVAKSKRDAAARDLAKAEVVAPVAGVVAQVDGMNVGEFVSPAGAVLSMVQADRTWIEANFKETQLDTLKVGQPVEVTLDAYPGLSLHGAVESFGSATGSEFSIIPAQNATGNWVKVVQRLAVRVALTSESERVLRGGMSAHVSVDTGASHLDALR